tara:strand:+ start:325 stop:594 length:270 start_codon:yes stop_codon:yes gene_type:complete
MSDTVPEPEPIAEVESTPTPTPTPDPAPVKKKREVVKMSEKQKLDLSKHMDKVGKDMTVTERKSYRMKMMGKMRKGETVAKASKAIKSA